MRYGPVGAYQPHEDTNRRTYFAELLIDLRCRRGMTQYRLAKLCAVSSGYITRLEHGDRYPSCEVVERIITALALGNLQANALRMAAGYAPRTRTRPTALPASRFESTR